MVNVVLVLAAMTVFVSPEGDDANPGTAERPFATAVRARDFLRSAKDRGKAEVVFRRGVYKVCETLSLDNRDSGTTWRGEDGTVFDGGFEVRDLRKVDATDSFAIQQLAQTAVSNVLVADVKAAGYRAWERQCRYGGAVKSSGMSGARSTRCTKKGTTLELMTDLWCNGGPMELAREPDTKFLKLTGIDNGEVSFVTDCAMREKLSRERELMVCGFWHWNYLDETAAVHSMSRDGKVVMDDCIFTLNGHYKTMRAKQPYFFVNALCALDQPGEWFLDRADGKLYLIPLKLKKGPDNKFPEQHFVLSEFADDFVTISNGVDIAFENLTFEHGKRHGVVASDSRSIVVRKCRIERLGGRAVVFDRVWEARVEDCVVKYMGTAGVQLVSGDRVTLKSGESVVCGNEISFASQRRRTYSPALDLDGVGTLVEKNYFHDLRSSAINMRGNDQMIYNNYIERAVLESDDQGALDTYGYVSFQGNRIVGNVWKDIGGNTHDGYIAGQAGVRLDDVISGVYIASNVFINAAKGNFGALHMNGGRANVIEDNVFFNCRSKRDAAITIGGNTQWAWNHRLSQKQWQSTPLWHEDMFSEAYKKYPMMRESDLVTVFKDDNVVRHNYVTGCRDVVQRSHYNPNGYYYEYFGGEDGQNVHRENPRVEMRLLSKDGTVEAAVRYDRKNGAKVRILK